MNSTEHYRRQINEMLVEYEHARRTLKDEKAALKEAQIDAEEWKEAQAIIQTVAQAFQKKAHSQIAGVVTRCLESVFDEPYEFQVRFDRKRGKTEAALVFVRDGKERDARSIGGGVVDVASFALRLAALLLSRPPQRLLQVLDEPMKWVSKNHTDRLRALITSLSDELGIQFLIVTHDTGLKLGKVIRIGANDDEPTAD